MLSSAIYVTGKQTHGQWTQVCFFSAEAHSPFCGGVGGHVPETDLSSGLIFLLKVTGCEHALSSKVLLKLTSLLVQSNLFDLSIF